MSRVGSRPASPWERGLAGSLLAGPARAPECPEGERAVRCCRQRTDDPKRLAANRLAELPKARPDQIGAEADEHEVRDREERTQRKPPAAPVHEPAEARRDGEAGEAADHGQHGLRRVRGGEQEERRLKPLTCDGEKGQSNESAAAQVESCIDLAAQMRALRARLTLHPDDHPGEDTGGGQHDDALEQLFARPLKLGAGEEQRCSDSATHGTRRGDSRPDTASPVREPHLPQVGEDDGDNECGFKAFTQGHKQWGNHEAHLSLGAG